MKIDERDLEERIDRALSCELGDATGLITICVDNGFVRWINLDIEQDDEEDD